MRLESYEPRLAGISNEKFVKAIIKSLSVGIKKGEDMPTLANRVKKAFPKIDEESATTIAVTETSRLTTEQDIAQWASSKVVGGKKWLASHHSCPYCCALSGKQVPLDMPFFEKGQEWAPPGMEPMKFDEQIDGPPLHENCSCCLLAVLKEVGG